MRRVWLSAMVTAPTPEAGEVIGLSVFDITDMRWLVDHAAFRPVKRYEPLIREGVVLMPEYTFHQSWDGAAGHLDACVKRAPMRWHDLEQRLPFTTYTTGLQTALSGPLQVEGPHVKRDLLFSSDLIPHMFCNITQ